MATVEDIFKEILGHMLKGLMFHEQSANYYDFLGLEGYKRCHEYHFFDESHSYRKLYHYYIKKYNQLLPPLPFENPDVVPQSWLGYRRQDVDSKTKRAAVKDGLDSWVQWEKDTCKLYQKKCQELDSLGEVGASCKLKKILCEVEKELQTAEKYQLYKMASDYDINVIIDEQKPFHHKYKELMMKEVH